MTKVKSENKYLEVAKLAANSAGNYLVDNFGNKHIPTFKSQNDIGLAEDIESEKIILDIIKKNYPEHNYFSEEIGEVKNSSEYTWFIDPLDGTNNYFAGIPYFSVSIALLQKDELILGVVYNPISNQLFEASKGCGAFLNGDVITPSNNLELTKSVSSFIQGHEISSSENLAREASYIKEKLSNNFRRVLSTWAPSLDWALLASGGIDALISFESELEDMYAGLLIAKEAGLKTSNFTGDEANIYDKRIVASKNLIHKEVLDLINN